jgi:hypothetical protein
MREHRPRRLTGIALPGEFRQHRIADVRPRQAITPHQPGIAQPGTIGQRSMAYMPNPFNA